MNQCKIFVIFSAQWNLEHHLTAYSLLWNPNINKPLSPGQTIVTCQRNISQHCWAQHVACIWPPCCDMLGENGQIFMQHLWMLHVAWCCSHLSRFMQQCCAWAFPLVWFSTRNMTQHVVTGSPNACNMLRPTMLPSVAFKCCDRLAGACRCWANIIGICCIEMLLTLAGA